MKSQEFTARARKFLDIGNERRTIFYKGAVAQAQLVGPPVGPPNKKRGIPSAFRADVEVP